MAQPLPPFEPDLARAHTLPSWLYTSPQVLALERERIFARTWLPVGPAGKVGAPGDFFTCTAIGEPIVITRDEAGRLRAFFNVCRHRAGAVALGCGRRRTLQCHYHGWTYSLDGSLRGTPEFEGVEGFDRAGHGLVPVRVAEWGPLVFVNLADDAPPLEAILGDVPGRLRDLDLPSLRLIERREYPVRCNWKAYVDNYLEGYHIPVAHPALYRELDYAHYAVETFRFHSLQHSPYRPADGAGRLYAAETVGGPALFAWFFPGWMLNRYPDHLQLNMVEPLAADATRVVFEWYAAPADEAARASVERGIALGEQTQREDVALCESVQERLGSRAYTAGRFSVRRENGVHHFQALVHEFLTSETTPAE
jgi:choline monooxygenase